MNRRTFGNGPAASPRPKGASSEGNPHPIPDLFGFVPPATPTKPSTRSTPAATPTPAEWPAARDRRPVPAFAAPDRPLAAAPRPPADLSGVYDRNGSRLDRAAPDADGVTLWIRQSHRQRRGHTHSERYVDVGYPGSGKPPYAGSLYDRRRPGVPGPHDDLDGHAFQHGDGGRWYVLRLASPGRYRVEPTTGRRRGRSGR